MKSTGILALGFLCALGLACSSGSNNNDGNNTSGPTDNFILDKAGLESFEVKETLVRQDELSKKGFYCPSTFTASVDSRLRVSSAYKVLGTDTNPYGQAQSLTNAIVIEKAPKRLVYDVFAQWNGANNGSASRYRVTYDCKTVRGVEKCDSRENIPALNMDLAKTTLMELMAGKLPSVTGAASENCQAENSSATNTVQTGVGKVGSRQVHAYRVSTEIKFTKVCEGRAPYPSTLQLAAVGTMDIPSNNPNLCAQIIYSLMRVYENGQSASRQLSLQSFVP